MIKKPVITEKSLQLANTQNKYTFEVERHAHKHQIKEAIEQLFSVSVTAVNTKLKYRVRKTSGRKRLKTIQAPTKLAVVELKSGQTIDLFDVYSA